VDPLASKYPGVSPYVFCFSNPINFIDFNGEEPTAEEAALMAKHVYGGRDAEKVQDELNKTKWKVSKAINKIDSHYGLQYQLYEKTNDNKTEYALVFAGTNDVIDAVDDLLQVIGISPQYYQAVDLSVKVKESLKGNELTFIGHSLGGGLAAISSRVTGLKAITFNPACVSINTSIATYLFYDFKSNSNITNHITVGKKILWGVLRIGGDPLNIIQSKLFFVPPGEKKYVETNSPSLSHGIDYFIH
jgi:hypothetical protein